MNKAAKFGIGLGVGLLLGVATALLLTPKSGKENRRILKEKIKGWRDKLKKKKGV
jgi:gas vesicle protein